MKKHYQYAVWQRIEIARARPRQLAAHRPFQQLKVQLAAATRRADRLTDLHRAADRDLIRSRINVAVVYHLVGERAVAVQHEDVVRFAARAVDRAANQRHHTTLSHRRHLVLSARVHVNGRVTLVVAATLAKVDRDFCERVGADRELKAATQAAVVRVAAACWRCRWFSRRCTWRRDRTGRQAIQRTTEKHIKN